jgi:DNA-binding LacI/PurR family transcriptional regulator
MDQTEGIMDQQFTPTYYVIKSDIKKKVAQGILQAGETLPGRNKLTSEYNCSWSTINRAINELILEGVLIAQKGVGTFVATSNYEKPVSFIKVWFCHPFPSVYASLSEMMDGLRDEAHARGLSTQFIDQGPNEYPVDLSGYVVVTPSSEQYDYLCRAWLNGQRFVVLNSDFEEAPFVCVNSNLFPAYLEAMEMLMNEGHKKIGLIGIRNGFSGYEQRKNAYRDAYQRFGYPYLEDWIVGRPEDLLDAKQLYSEWMDEHPECTAVFTADYTSSLIVLDMLYDRGSLIPEHISMFASGKIPFDSILKVSLNTVIQPFYDLGRKAASILINKEWGSESVTIDCKLVIRNSVLPASVYS